MQAVIDVNELYMALYFKKSEKVISIFQNIPIAERIKIFTLPHPRQKESIFYEFIFYPEIFYKCLLMLPEKDIRIALSLKDGQFTALWSAIADNNQELAANLFSLVPEAERFTTLAESADNFYGSYLEQAINKNNIALVTNLLKLLPEHLRIEALLLTKTMYDADEPPYKLFATLDAIRKLQNPEMLIAIVQTLPENEDLVALLNKALKFGQESDENWLVDAINFIATNSQYSSIEQLPKLKRNI